MTIKAAIIGSGFIGPAHLEAIRRLGFVEVVALCDSSQAAAEEKARRYQIPHAYGDVAELLQHPGLQVVHNCTPNHLHAAINRQILLAGKHVFSEKPLCMTAAEARQLVTLAEQAGVVHGVSFVYRQFAMVQQAASMVRQQQAGRIFATHGSYLQDWMLYDSDFNWRIDPQQGGVSRTVADIGSHWCDTLQFVTGRKIVEVLADFSIVHPYRQAPRGAQRTFSHGNATADFDEVAVETEDFASVLLRFDDGSKGSMNVSQVSAGRKNRLAFEVNASKLSLGWDQETPQNLWIGQRDQPNQQLSDAPSLLNPDVAAAAHFPGGHIERWPDAFKNMLLNFYRTIRDGSHPAEGNFATFHDGAAIMCIIEAIVRSHAEQRWIKVAY